MPVRGSRKDFVDCCRLRESGPASLLRPVRPAQSIQLFVIISITIVTMLSATGASTTQQFPGPPSPREISAAEAGRVMALIYQGDTPGAIGLIDSLAATCGGEPFYLVVKARVFRELLTIDDERKDQVKIDTRPIHTDLDLAIEVCNSRMNAGDNDPALRLYRGLAWMSKSHLHSFSRSFWRAGREAKKGKKDLEAYLDVRPEDPLACGTLGAFYYFADTLPGFFKFLSRLVLMPTGDRQKGLRYIETAAGGESVFKTDFEILLHTIFFLFEGKYEDGLEGINALWEQHPRYPRLASPLLLMRPFIPRTAHDSGDRLDAFIDKSGDAPAEALGRYGYSLLRFLRAYSDRFYSEPLLAEVRFLALIEDNPTHPDWVTDYARFELGRMLASQGRTDQARELFEAVRGSDTGDYLHGEAKDMLDDLENDFQPSNVPEEGWITKIYHCSEADRGEVISLLQNLERPTCLSIFYIGDALLLVGDMDGALEAFESVLGMEVPEWDQEYQMLAASRVAEIQGARGDYEAASKSLSRALSYYHKEFLVDWILEGRQRYFERLHKGQEAATPTLYLHTRP